MGPKPRYTDRVSNCTPPAFRTTYHSPYPSWIDRVAFETLRIR